MAPQEYHSIGTQVTFIPIVPKYSEDNIRYLSPLGHMELGVVVGLKDIPLGRYRPGGNTSSWLDEPDYDPPYLSVDRVVRVYRVRTHLLGKEHLSLIKDTVPSKHKFILPLAGRIRQWLLED